MTAWRIFITLSSQSRVGGMGGFIGFDYTSLPVLFRAHGVDESIWLFYIEKFDLITTIAHRYWNTKSEA